MSSAQPVAGDVVVLVAAGLGTLVLGRLAAGALVRAAARGSGRLARAVRAAVAALRPGVGRRAVAAALGVSASVVGPLAPARASATPVPPAGAGAPMHQDDAAARPPARPPVARPAVHVVHRGETLWGIARDHLPAHATDAQVARAWPRWYAANRRVIGRDPSLIVPGQHLRVPGRRSAGTPTQPHVALAPPTGTPVPSAQSLDPDRR